MIQIQAEHIGIIVLEPGNFEALKAGKILRVPTPFNPPIRELVIDWTPDVRWCTEQFALAFADVEPDRIDPREIQKIVKASQSRTPVLERPEHGAIDVLQFARGGNGVKQ